MYAPDWLTVTDKLVSSASMSSLLSSDSFPPRSGLSVLEHHSTKFCLRRCRAKKRSAPNEVLSRGRLPAGTWKYLLKSENVPQ